MSPFSALLVINQSRGTVYAYYALRTVASIISKGTIFCIAVAYAVSSLLFSLDNIKVYTTFTVSLTISQADVVDESKRAAVFGWMTGLFSASLVVGNLLARFLPEDYIFQVCLSYELLSIHVLIFCCVIM